ncbi:hypothetical protein [Erythrobacter sp. THAF29]|uniref:hypothetical protein n=1 Tax=Erythrobacter sp. THAF29 TaxID=2587851 RepID=UPI0012684D4E|nr:hypothetical protein [Erythrobacter sp. THAF29]QFT76739.1 hypothetical protein FIU90_04190 [Erythrobacter sp. THAF29]
MRAFPAAAAAMLAFAMPSVAQAEEPPVEAPEAELAELSNKLADPNIQAHAAAMVQVLMGHMLDLEIGPFVDAIDRATDGSGPDVPSDARLRDLAPEVEDMSEEFADRVPEAMNSMSAMADGMGQMIPSFLELADRMRQAMEQVHETEPGR